MHVLEIGSGWGGFALYAAGELDCRVTTITISKAQHELATRRVGDGRARGPRQRRAARLPRGRPAGTTPIVSIEMLEAVGAEYFYGTFFAACDRALGAGGQGEPPGDHPARRRLRAAAPRRELDPGLHLPGRPGAVPGGHRALAPRHTPAGHRHPGHRVQLRANAGEPGAPICWRTASRSWHSDFDERFLRMWEYYLAQSEAGFATGLIQDQQIVLEKRRGLAA